MREQFSTRFGAIAAAAGSAVGLGNIWKFPYETGSNGGAAFLLIYIVFVFGIGLPLMMSEFLIGRTTQRNVIGAFKQLAPGAGWKVIGSMGILAAFLILSFYSAVAGWSFEYIIHSFNSNFMNSSPQEINQFFDNFVSSPSRPLIWQVLFMLCTALIVIAGVKDGIERYAKILMPLLFLLIIVLDIRAITLPGAKEGLEFLFKPDFSKITTRTVLDALGQAFFSLSLGMGALITYGSYFGKNDNLTRSSTEVTFTDTLVAILAGVAIFPAVFAFGINPSEGPGLVYKTLPVVFQQMPAGNIFAFLFFTLLLVAALTSSISLLEVIVAYLVEEHKIKRRAGAGISALLITILGLLCSLSLGVLNIKFLDRNLFDWFEFIASNILLPLGGMLIAIFVGHFMDKKIIRNELTNHGLLKGKYFNTFIFIMKYLAPVAIGMVFLHGLGLFAWLSKFL